MYPARTRSLWFCDFGVSRTSRRVGINGVATSDHELCSIERNLRFATMERGPRYKRLGNVLNRNRIKHYGSCNANGDCFRELQPIGGSVCFPMDAGGGGGGDSGPECGT